MDDISLRDPLTTLRGESLENYQGILKDHPLLKNFIIRKALTELLEEEKKRNLVSSYDLSVYDGVVTIKSEREGYMPSQMRYNIPPAENYFLIRQPELVQYTYIRNLIKMLSKTPEEYEALFNPPSLLDIKKKAYNIEDDYDRASYINGEIYDEINRLAWENIHVNVETNLGTFYVDNGAVYTGSRYIVGKKEEPLPSVFKRLASLLSIRSNYRNLQSDPEIKAFIVSQFPLDLYKDISGTIVNYL